MADQRAISSSLASRAKWPVSRSWELAFREVALVAVRSVGRKDLDDAEQEASGEYRTPIAMGLGHKHLAPIACELKAWTGVRASLAVLSVLARSLGRHLAGGCSPARIRLSTAS